MTAMILGTPSLGTIEFTCKRYAEARDKVQDIVVALDAAMDALKRAEMPKLRRAVSRAAEIHDELRVLIDDAPSLFVKPKTLTLHGIRVGFMKGKGGIEWDDADAVVCAIQKYLPDQAEALIRWTGRPLKEALNQLDVASLKKLGCRVVDTGEAVVIKPVDSAVDKMVDALMKSAIEEVV